MRYAIAAFVIGLNVAAGGWAAALDDVTFHKDVLPILQKNCQTCHRPGQSAPMSLLSYDQVRPWAKAIKQAVSIRKMPPWSANPAVGHFSNDRSLKQADIDTLVAWVDKGAPAGNLKDAPPAIQWPEGGWQIKPDLIVEGPDYDVPAKAIVEWTGVTIPGPFTKDTWVTSIEVLPGQPQVTHHICLSFRPHNPKVEYWKFEPSDVPRDEDGVAIPRPAGQRAARPPVTPAAEQAPNGGVGGGIEECYEPGRQPADFRPFNAAKLIPAGTDIWLNLHYTPNGSPVKDHVRLGFTISKEPPQRRYFALSGSSPSDREHFAIPPGNPNWEAPPAEFIFSQDVQIVGLMPHMHVRGKSATFYLDYPDGHTETVLDVPNYDFNWQLWYDTSLNVPKGTKLRVVAHYDNSPNNKYNPDPAKTVYYGNQTWEEMHFPSFGVVVNDIKLEQRQVIQRNQAGTAAFGGN